MGFLSNIKKGLSKTISKVSNSLKKTQLNIIKGSKQLLKKVYFKVADMQDELEYSIKTIKEEEQFNPEFNFSRFDTRPKEELEIEEKKTDKLNTTTT